jgi:hypothetical protein
MFVEQALLELILYDQDEDVVYSEIVTAFALKCRTLKSIDLGACYDTWETVQKIVECCRGIEEFTLRDEHPHRSLARRDLMHFPLFLN